MTDEKKPIFYKIALNPEELKTLNSLKTLFGTRATAVRHGIYLLHKKHFDEITNELKPKYKKIEKKTLQYNLHKTSPEFKENKMAFRDNHQLQNLISYTYKLLKNHGFRAKRPILRNIKVFKNLLTDKDVIIRCKEFEYSIKNNFELIYDRYKDTLAINKAFADHNKKHITFIDMVCDIVSNPPSPKQIEIKKEKKEEL